MALRFLLALIFFCTPAFADSTDKSAEYILNRVFDGTNALNTSGGLSNFIDVTDYGAVGDGVTDDTEAIQDALDAGNSIYFPDGTYLINPDGSGGSSNTGGITPRSNSLLFFGGNAVLQAKTSSLTGYNILRLDEVSNVKIYGGIISGDRATHIGGSGEFGYCVGIWGSDDIYLDNVKVRDCWGDGIFITDVGTNRSERISGVGIVSDNNRRQGMSIIDGVDITFTDSYFINTNGTAPQDGIDIEPGGFGNAVENFKCIGCEFHSNAGRGFNVQSTQSGDVVNVQLIGGQAYSNDDAGITASRGVYGVSFSGMTVFDNAGAGIVAFALSGDGVKISDNYVHSNGTAANASIFQENIYSQTSNKVVIQNNVVRKGSNANKPTYGIRLNTDTNAIVQNNDIRNGGETGDYLNSAGTNTIFSGIGTKQELLNVTEQQRIGFNASNYYTTTVSSVGLVSFDAVGTTPRFKFFDAVNSQIFSSDTNHILIGSANGIISMDPGTTGEAQLNLFGTNGCIMFRDRDGAGYTEVSFLDGTIQSTTDADGVCDGS